MNFVDPIPEENWNAIGWVPNFVDREGSYTLMWLDPNVFLTIVDPDFNASRPEFRQASLVWLREQAEAGRAFAPLQVWLTPEEVEQLKQGAPPKATVIRSHEGRHRALLAAQLGLDEVPVAIWPKLRKLKTKLLR